MSDDFGFDRPFVRFTFRNARIQGCLVRFFLIFYLKLVAKYTGQKMKFSIMDFFSKCDQFPADLVKFTEEILDGKLRFLCNGKKIEEA